MRKADLVKVTEADRRILGDLAERQRKLADRGIEKEKARLWTDHNDLMTTVPLVFIDPENGWNEIIREQDLLCSDPLLREWERILRKEIFWGEEIKDDRVIRSFFDVEYVYEDTKWGLHETKKQVNSAGSYSWEHPLTDYEKDFDKLAFPVITVDYGETQSRIELAESIFGDILTVRKRGNWWWTLGMTWDFINLRGLENFMFDMYDHPEGIHRLMTFLSEGTISKIKWLEKNDLLSSNVGGEYVGSGGFGWTEQLPGPGSLNAAARLQDMWGFGESQETVGLAPDMFAEFILPYQIKVLENFGLNCYGCCEPIDPRWDYVKTIPRLRRVSCSPWADREVMSRQLEQNYIMSMKPSPTPLASAVMDEDEVRTGLRRDLAVVKDNVVEVIMKDNHTIGNNPRNVTRWVEIVREEIDRLKGM
ncbi:MAG: hypothetical protein JXR86_18015 [Spirochaetales bacterium]|nr:hypothetical protein [Spirochaetales bacterium]